MRYGSPYDDMAPVIGHNAHGGGATISNSPININISINISEGTRLEDEFGRPTEAGKTLGFLAKILSRGNSGVIEDGRSYGCTATGDKAIKAVDAALARIASK